MFSFTRIFSLALAVLLAGLVYAQDEEYLDYGESGDELVITAGRVPEAVKTVLAQITVITADDIAESGAASITGVLETAAGVRFSGAQAGLGSETISMRGFGENSYGRVLVLVDGNKLNNPDMQALNWNAIPLTSIERIEILDGSASVQYGNNAVGGVINIITKKGGSRRTAVTLTGGSFFYNKESLTHFQPLSWGNFSLSAEHSGTKGYRERQEARTVNLTGSADVNISETMKISFNGFFADLYYQLPGGLSKDEFEKDPKQALDFYGSPNLKDENTERHFGGGIGVQWFPTDTIELNLPLSYMGKLIKSDMASYSSYTDKTLHSMEARPQGSVTFTIANKPLRLLGGADIAFSRLGSGIYSDPAYTTKTNSFEISEWTIGPYVTARFSLLPNLYVSAGVRFDNAIISAKNRDGTADGNKTFTALVYDGGIVYNPLEELKLYAKYASLFRYPFVDELAEVYSGKFNSNLKPEKGFNVEAGTAYRFGTMLDISANLFFMQLEDEIAYNNTTNANENMDKTQRLGTNVSISLMPITWLSIDTSYSFVSAIFAGGGNKDKSVPMVPEQKIYGSLMAYLPCGEAKLGFGPDLEYVSACYYGQDFANKADTMDPYFLLGMRVRFVLDKNNKRLTLQITGKNLLDTRYAAYGTAYYNTYTSPAVWQYTLYPADGRSINVLLSYRF
ncbi:TonB-dependent receptor [Spirochaetia bacterium]|nr:TonB-dependent receptor [Spirochaetia bacterium]